MKQKKPPKAGRTATITFHGLPVETVIFNLLQVAKVWGKLPITEKTINENGFEILGDFVRAMGGQVVYEVDIPPKKPRRRKK